MLHRNIELVDKDAIQGRGLVAKAPIRRGEIVSRLEPDQPTALISDVLTWPQEHQDELLHYGYQCNSTQIVNEQGNEKYMNHSCDPNTWWLDDETMIARRDIKEGEEVTYDYATTEVTIPFEMNCHCGAANCRGVITNRDHLNIDWQVRFGKHLPHHTLMAIAAASSDMD